MQQSNQDIRATNSFQRPSNNEVKLSSSTPQDIRYSPSYQSQRRNSPPTPSGSNRPIYSRGYNPGNQSYMADRISRNQDCREVAANSTRGRSIPYRYPSLQEQSYPKTRNTKTNSSCPKQDTSKPKTGVTIKGNLISQ